MNVQPYETRSRRRHSIVDNFLDRLKYGMDTALHLEIGRGISDYAKEKWDDFSFNPESFSAFFTSLCEAEDVPDDPTFGFVSDVTIVPDEPCEIGVTCNEDGTSITQEGKRVKFNLSF